MAETRKYTVTGMTCDHCEAAIRGELAELIGIEKVQVSAPTGSLTVSIADGVEIPDATIVEAVEEAGYPAERVR
ncbi:heavy-metal-associated domain-containing protein [Nesterenkonia salmonea]|uniref:Heavy-metal-associated domain-containing protein n=1 Tax=Nesterenkonia salmonea TaxID=1804987 RepID=A0A5R9BG95_9MICC|nr:heavy-metal-associated domain-containing protein [Nesterenkonia salmonea]TLP99676.1 heavy-metal-associated domain-containing protein [Nesterenkonia salmonea]